MVFSGNTRGGGKMSQSKKIFSEQSDAIPGSKAQLHYRAEILEPQRSEGRHESYFFFQEKV